MLAIAGVGSLLALALALLGSDSPAAPGGKGPPRVALELPLAKARVEPRGKRPDLLTGKPVGRGEIDWLRPDRRRDVAPAMDVATVWEAVSRPRGETVSIGHGKTAVLGSALVEHGRFQARLKRGPRSVPKRLVFDEVLTSREERVIDGCILAPFQECEKRALSFRDLLAADLRGADLSKTALIRSLASGAALAGSDLRGTDLRGATLLDANLKGAALRGANLADASLHFARVKGKQLRGAYLCNTQLPSGKRSDRDCGAPAPDGPPGAGTDGTNPVVAAEAPSPSAPRPFDDGHDAGPQGQGDARPLPRTPSIDDPHAITAAPKANCKLPPSQDTDKDRLKDCAELAGYTLNVVSPTEVGGTPKAVKVDSDPKDPDTDNDGIDDGVERDRNGNPREQDTDDDGLTDDREANDYRSKLNDADSDNDSQKDPDLFDGSEVKDFRTSPKDADTDGDGSTDFTELKSDSTNARVSQLPQISLDRAPGVEQVKVSVPYTSTTGSTKIERTAEAKQTANTDTHSVTTNDTFAFDLSEQVKGSLNPFKLAGIKVSAKQSYEHNWAINDTHTGTTTQSYSTYEKDSTTTTVAVQPSGCVEAQVVFHNTSRVAYKLGQIQVRALTPDPRDPSQLKLLSALQPVAGNPVGNCPGTSSGTTIELGPGDRQTVALAGIADSHSDLLPYLANPTAIEFEMGSYTLTGTAANGQTIDYLGKTAQDVNNRTAAVTVDFGDDNPLSYRVAAATEFDDRARPLGVRIDDALSEALDGASGGLAPKYDAKGFLGSLRAPGGTVVTNASDPNLGRWFSISNADGFGDAGEKFASTRLKPGDVLAVSFAKDTDDDDLIDVSEDYFGTSRTQPDTDSDGLSDSLEANVGWTVPLPRGQDSSYKVFSSPTSCDADRDGSPDGPGPGNAAFGACPKGPPESSRASSAGPKRMFGTDPSLVDTNRDGIFDATQPYPDVLRNTPPGGRVPQFLRQWGGAGNGNGRFGSNGGLAVNPAGDQIFVADNGNLADSNRSQSIQKFTGSPLDGVPQYASTVPLFSCGRNGLIFDLAWSPERMGPQPSDGNVLWASRSLSPACEHKVVFDRINSATGARTAGGTYSNGVPANPLVAGPNPSWMGAFISVPDASGNIWVSKAGDVPWDTRQCLNYDELHNPDYLPTEYRPATSETVENLRAIGSVGTKPRDTYCRIDPHYSPAYMEKTPRNVEIRPADLQNPAGIGFGKNGEMYVADRFPWGRSGVVRLASGTGEQTANFFTGYQNANPDSRLLWPAGLTVDRQNGYVYVVDQGNASNFNNITDLMADDPGRKIYKFSESLTPLATFGAPGGGEGTFGNPIDIEADGRGDLYVSDEGNKVVQFFHYPYGP